MKTRLIILVLLVVCFSCGTNNKPVSDAQKEKIKGELKEVINTLFKSAEEANFDKIIELWYDSPDFVYMSNGNTYNYKAFVDAVKPMLGSFLNQKCTIVDEKFAVLDNTTVLYTANSRWLVNYKDGHSALQDPWAMSFIFKKADDRWKVIYCTESGVEKSIPDESTKELNKIELLKQFLGTWKGEIGKDTIYVAEQKLYGNGLLSAVKTVTKGKTIMEGNTIIGYDSKSDKTIEASLVKGSDITVMGILFTSKNTAIEIPYEYLSNPQNAPVIWQYEFKSPDLMVWSYIENNKTTGSITFHREK